MKIITDPDGSLDAENVCGADAGEFLGSASDFNSGVNQRLRDILDSIVGTSNFEPYNWQS